MTMELRELIVSSPYTAKFQVSDGWRSLKVSPRSAPRHIANDMHFRADSRGNLVIGNTASKMEPPYLSYMSFRKALVPDLFALGAAFLAFARWRRRRVLASLDGVTNVVFLASPAQMVWVAAWLIVAGVERVGRAFWRRPVFGKAGNARSDVLDAARLSVSHREKSITEPVARFGCPRPALILASNVDLAPETGLIFLRHSKHAASYCSTGK